MIDELKLVEWLGQHKASLSMMCRRYLLHPKVYVIIEALKVENYQYTFRDTQGTKMELSVSKIKDFMDVGTDIKYTVTGGGELEIRAPLYIAFRKAKLVSFDDVPGIVPDEEPGEIMQRYLSKKKFD